MRRKQKPAVVVPASDKLHEIAEGESLNWPADDSPAAPTETGTSAGSRLRDEALRAQAEQQLARPDQSFFL